GFRKTPLSEGGEGQIQSNCFRVAGTPFYGKITDEQLDTHYTTVRPDEVTWPYSPDVPRFSPNSLREYGAFPYSIDMPQYSGSVQTYVIFRNYRLGDYARRKADLIDVYGPQYGGHFVWQRSMIPIAGASWLITHYNWYCEESGLCSGYKEY
ncbi:MAG: hypothetical protein AAF203_08580, partial [Pseudomonadota bacterium]